MQNYMFITLRHLRTIKDYIYHFIRTKKVGEPDSHIVKRQRILRVLKSGDYQTLLETGTFYGQTVSFFKKYFNKVLSVELHPELFKQNKFSFKKDANVKIYFGDSSIQLNRMIDEIEGRAIFWLDGHFSGNGTAKSDVTSPILNELDVIRIMGRTTDAILIDDLRLFSGLDGYPTIEDTIKAIKKINEDYHIQFDSDCIIATLNK